MGVGLLHFWGKIELRQSILGLFLWQFGTFWWTLSYNICFWEFREELQTPTRRETIVNKSNTR